MISSGINLVMTVIGFSLSTMFIVFVCTRLICARIHLNAWRRSLDRTTRSDLSILERGFNGLEPLTMANFPTMKYRELCLSSKENAQCSICLTDYHEEDTLRILPLCGHSFHAICIDIWLQQHSTCPVCRISLCELPERKWFMQPMFSSVVRSQYNIRFVNTHYCPCMMNGHRRSSRSRDITDPMQEIQCRFEGDGESNSVAVDHNQMIKDLGDRKVESPSNE
ncbi:hypothetical protein BUALT_Bualt06G0032400 [Buddleja alternifolia]|uniref:RING-type E3 ubiquitin transferase n=1 Tax=Buddleja alternifolia TaxID=168488 RepID=A0AAV6XKA1_9LAMI|nr:hypothetical protein BUALT_Bualt06G0032400 [Buddleja alternifolia]